MVNQNLTKLNIRRKGREEHNIDVAMMFNNLIKEKMKLAGVIAMMSNNKLNTDRKRALTNAKSGYNPFI